MKGKIIAVGVIAVVLVVAAGAALMLVGKPGNEPGSVDFGTYDQPPVEDLMYEHDLSYEAASFLALTEFEVQRIGDNVYQIDARFPTGNTARLTVEVFLDEVYHPSAGELAMGGAGGRPRAFGMKLSSRETSEAFDFRLEYFIPYDFLPEEAIDSLRSAAAPADRSLLQALFPIGPVRAQESGGMDGVKVVVEGAVQSFAWDQLQAFEQVVGQRGNIAGMKTGNLTKTASAVTSVLGSWDLKEKHEDRKRRLEKLRDCAENPTNPLTQKMYQEDPASKERILKEIELRQFELNSHTTVRFINAMNSVAAGLVPVLGTIVGAAGGWVDEGLDESSEGLVDEVKNMVTPCEEENVVQAAWSGTITETRTTKMSDATSSFQETFTQVVTITGAASIPGVPGMGEGLRAAAQEGVTMAFLAGTISATYEKTYKESHLDDYQGAFELAWRRNCTPQTSSQEAQASGQGRGQASINVILMQGMNSISVNSNDRLAATETFTSVSHFYDITEGCDIETTTKTDESLVDLGLGGIEIHPTVDQGNPDVLAGSATRTEGDTTITTTWSLTRTG